MPLQMPPHHLDRHVGKGRQQLLPHKQGFGVLCPTEPHHGDLERLFQPAAMKWTETTLIAVEMQLTSCSRWPSSITPAGPLCRGRDAHRIHLLMPFLPPAMCFEMPIHALRHRGAGSRRTFFGSRPPAAAGPAAWQRTGSGGRVVFEFRQAQCHTHQQGEFWVVWSQELQNSLGLGAIQPTHCGQRSQKCCLRPAHAAEGQWKASQLVQGGLKAGRSTSYRSSHTNDAAMRYHYLKPGARCSMEHACTTQGIFHSPATQRAGRMWRRSRRHFRTQPWMTKLHIR